MNISVICQQCGTRFEVKPSRANSAKFCSRLCRTEWDRVHFSGQNSAKWKQKKPQTCLVCGEEFYLKPSSVARGYGKFCSVRCLAIHRKSLTGEKAGRWQGGKVEITCQICNAKFRLWPSQIKLGGGKFCSKSCRHQWQKLRMAKGNNHKWRGGKSFEPYTAAFNQAFKTAVRKRDNNSCRWCGKHGRDVHHIDYNKERTTFDNCLTLCASCHSRTNDNRHEWQLILSDLARNAPLNGYLEV